SGTLVSILRPMFGKMRPSHDISNGLPGGPTACEARLENGIEMCVGWGVLLPSTFLKMTAFGSRSPNGFTPLKLLLARPSQKLRKLNAALITVGALRPVTRRTLVPLILKTGSCTAVQKSTPLVSAPGAPGRLKLRSNTP